MPISNNREIIPFVNKLEYDLNEVTKDVDDWKRSKSALFNGIRIAQSANNSAAMAISKADEALAELTAATFGVTADRGNRLKTVLDNLKEEIVEIVENMEIKGSGGSGGGGGEVTEGEVFEEINNAISNVDSSVHPGLKLDYIINSLRDDVKNASSIKYKRLNLITKETFEYKEGEIPKVPKLPNDEYLAHRALVLDKHFKPVVTENGSELHSKTDKAGNLLMHQAPKLEEGEKYHVYYFLERNLEDTPKEAVQVMLEMLVQKGEKVETDISSVEIKIEKILEDIELMKGKYWTPDFSIMKNHIDLSKELLTPKGVHLRESDGKTILSFSYVDHEALSHFVAERYDEDQEKWIPIDNGNDGVISK